MSGCKGQVAAANLSLPEDRMLLIVKRNKSHKPAPEERVGKMREEKNYKQKVNKTRGLAARVSKADGTAGYNSCN